MKTQAKEDSLDEYYGPTPFLDLHAEDPSTIPDATALIRTESQCWNIR